MATDGFHAMNAPDPLQQNDGALGVYQRATAQGTEFWRVSVGDRAQTYRLEHGVAVHGMPIEDAATPFDIDFVVDDENLRGKLKKWRREGFAVDIPASTIDDEANQQRARRAFAADLKRVSSKAVSHAPRDDAPTIDINGVPVPLGAGHVLVPRVNDAYRFAPRYRDVVQDIVENRRVMLIGHTGSGKTSLI